MKAMISYFHIYEQVAIDIENSTVLIGSNTSHKFSNGRNENPDLILNFVFKLSSDLNGFRLYRHLNDALFGKMARTDLEYPSHSDVTIKEISDQIKYKPTFTISRITAKDLADVLVETNKHTDFKGLKEIVELKESDEMANVIESYNLEDDFYVQEDFQLAFSLAGATFENGGFLNIHIVGPSGFGKTSFFEHIAQKFDKNILQMNCAVVLDPEKWFGRTQAKNGNTYFEPTPFTEALEAGNCVILLDEIGRVNAEIANSLFPILDHRRATTIGNHTIKCGEGIVFGMTENIGYQYTGSMQIDAALANRNIIKLEVKPLPRDVELALLVNNYPLLPYENVIFIVDICRAIREIILEEDDFSINLDVSTRTSKAMGELIQLALMAELPVDMQTVLDYTIFNHCDKRVVVSIIDKLKTSRLI